MNNVVKVLLLVPTISYAGVNSGDRKIESIGCHKHDNTCFVSISGNSVGPDSCSSTSVRWDLTKSPNGQEALSHLTAAFFAGRSVDLRISSVCYTEQAGYPTFDWWTIK